MALPRTIRRALITQSRMLIQRAEHDAAFGEAGARGDGDAGRTEDLGPVLELAVPVAAVPVAVGVPVPGVPVDVGVPMLLNQSAPLSMIWGVMA